jgi:KUP system potassium uptake protein
VDGASCFPSKIELTAGPGPTMARWRRRAVHRLSHIRAAAGYFALPRNRSVITGSRIEE